MLAPSLGGAAAAVCGTTAGATTPTVASRSTSPGRTKVSSTATTAPPAPARPCTFNWCRCTWSFRPNIMPHEATGHWNRFCQRDTHTQHDRGVERVRPRRPRRAHAHTSPVCDTMWRARRDALAKERLQVSHVKDCADSSRAHRGEDAGEERCWLLAGNALQVLMQGVQ